MGYDNVEMVAEGPREKLENFGGDKKKVREPGNVDEAKVEWETALGEYGRFCV